jgi:hypothetical protein
MDTLSINNPVITQAVLIEEYRKMTEKEFLMLIDDTLKRCKKFAELDDSKFSKELSEHEATQYAYLCKTFNEKLGELNHMPRSKVAVSALASTVAWWSVISTFKTMHGK